MVRWAGAGGVNGRARRAAVDRHTKSDGGAGAEGRSSAHVRSLSVPNVSSQICAALHSHAKPCESGTRAPAA